MQEIDGVTVLSDFIEAVKLLTRDRHAYGTQPYGTFLHLTGRKGPLLDFSLETILHHQHGLDREDVDQEKTYVKAMAQARLDAIQRRIHGSALTMERFSGKAGFQVYTGLVNRPDERRWLTKGEFMERYSMPLNERETAYAAFTREKEFYVLRTLDVVDPLWLTRYAGLRIQARMVISVHDLKRFVTPMGSIKEATA